jgi:hypothetical protein
MYITSILLLYAKLSSDSILIYSRGPVQVKRVTLGIWLIGNGHPYINLVNQ